MIAIGGCGEFGMNMTAYAYKGTCVIVDCGLVFAETYEIGVDSHIPSPSALEEVLGGIPDAFLITHGHEDHIGALPYFLPFWNIPVHIGPWALELVKEKLLQRNDSFSYQFNSVTNGTKTRIGEHFQAEWIHVPHSIPHCSSLLISAENLHVFHTGDFKSRGFAPHEKDLDLKALGEISSKIPITLLVSDSTNALSPGHCQSESTTFEPLKKLIEQATGATFVTTFSSNLWRINTVLRVAKSLKKKIFVFGAGMRKAMDLGQKLNLLEETSSVLIDEQELQKTERKNLIVMISGCQGEYRSGMFRLVNEEISLLRLREGDQCIFSSRTIPGNEKSIAKIISKCHLMGAAVYTGKEAPGIHVSGHAHAEDLRDLWSTLKPRYYMPVHGTFTQITGNQSLVGEQDFIPIANGQLLSVGSDGWELLAEFDLPKLFIDSWSKQTMDYETMRARHKIGDSGLAVATGIIDSRSIQLDFDFIGLPFQGDNDTAKVREILSRRITELHARLVLDGNVDQDNFNEKVRQIVRKFLTDRFIKKPVVLSRISLGVRT